MKKIYVFIFLLTAPVWGQSSMLSLEDVWQLLLTNNQTLKQAELTLKQAEKEIAIQRSGFLPKIDFSHKTSYVSEIAQIEFDVPIPGIPARTIDAGVKDQFDFSLQLTQPLFTGFRTRNLVKSANAQKQVQVHSLDAVQDQLRLQTGQLFYAIQLLGLQQNILAKSIDRTESHLQTMRDLLDAKQIAAYDTLEAAARKLEFETQRQHLIRTEQIQLSKLKLLLNSREPFRLRPIAIENAETDLQSQETFQQTAIQNRAELRQLQAGIKATQFGYKAAKSVYWPQIFAAAGYHYARPGVDFFANEWMDYYTVGVQVQWNLFAGGRDANTVAKTRIETEKMQLKLQDSQHLISQQVEEAWLSLQNIQEQIELKTKLVAQAQERARVARIRYTEGQISATEVDDAELALTQAELQLQSTKIEWFVETLRMDFYTGTIGNNLN